MSKKWKLEKKTGDVCWSVWDDAYKGKVASTTITNDEIVKAVMVEKGLVETDDKLRSEFWDAVIKLLPKSISSKYYFVAFEGDILCRSETYARALENFLNDMGFYVGVYKYDDDCHPLYGYWDIVRL